MLPAQKLAALQNAFRAVERDVNGLMRADRSDFDLNPLCDAMSAAEDALAALDVQANAYFDHIDNVEYLKRWGTAA